MKSTRVMAAACSVLLWGATVATAGNHIACYKVKDVVPKQKIGGVSLLSNTGSVGAQAPCTISTRAKYCCDSVDKIGVPPQPGGGGPLGPASKFCCYKVKCPKGVTGTLSVQDQFGTRALAIAKPPSLVCAPASPSGAFLDAAAF
jgi:hypothetical protein